jgi:hypothetical protein
MDEGIAMSPDLQRDTENFLSQVLQRELGGMMADEVDGVLAGGEALERFLRKFKTQTAALEEKAMQRGLVQGRKKGLRALRSLLNRLLRRRFGDVSAAAQARIGKAAEADIEHWIESVLDAPDVDAVLASQADRHGPTQGVT